MDQTSITQAQHTGSAVILALSFTFCCLVAYMSIFGQRMTFRAIRWHALNAALWGIAQAAFVASYGDLTPWTGFMHNKYVAANIMYINMLCLTAFPSGGILLMLETLIAFIVPSVLSSKIFCGIFFFLILILNNFLLIMCFMLRVIYKAKTDTKFYYDPISFYMILTMVIYVPFMLIYLVLAVIFTVRSFLSKRYFTTRVNRLELWSTLLYTLIPFIPYAATSGLVMVNYIATKQTSLYQFIQCTGGAAVGMAMPGCPTTTTTPAPTSKGASTTTTTAASPFGSSSSIEAMMAAMALLMKYMEGVAWSELCLPLLECCLVLALFASYQQQLLFVLSCGRLYNGKRRVKGDVGPVFIPVKKVGMDEPAPTSAQISEKVAATAAAVAAFLHSSMKKTN